MDRHVCRGLSLVSTSITAKATDFCLAEWSLGTGGQARAGRLSAGHSRAGAVPSWTDALARHFFLLQNFSEHQAVLKHNLCKHLDQFWGLNEDILLASEEELSQN